MKYRKFKQKIKEVAEKFRNIDKEETIRVISHHDADGISACSIIVKALNRENRKYSISIVTQLDEETLKGLAEENYNFFVFTDLGSGQINSIRKFFSEKKVIILDHHEPEEKFECENIMHVNPHFFGIEGTKEISGAGVVYFFAENLNIKNQDTAHIAIIGATGDIQEKDGFSSLNNEILDKAIEKNYIKVKKGLRFFGVYSKPLHKVLEYSTDPYIPGVTGSETGTIQFLQQIGINPKKGTEWKKLSQLSEEEIKKLVSAIIMKRFGEEIPEDVLGTIYLLTNEKEDSPLRDVREFSTLLNACGRLSKASLGIGACLGDEKIKQKAIQQLNKYKKEIINSLNWFKENRKDNKEVIIENGFVVINAKDNIPGTIIGTVASIISKSGEFKDGTFILSMAYLDNNIKASLRICGKKEDADLRAILKRITEKVGGQAGGHMAAAGAHLPKEKETEFLEAAQKYLGKISLEEEVA